MPTPSRNEIYEAVIRKMVAQALEERELAFEQAHSGDGPQELAEYLRGQARALGYSPRYKEIEGWRRLEAVFGDWPAALAAAGLPPAARCPVTKLPRVLAETERQKELYRRKKAEKKQRHQQRLQDQQEKRRRNKPPL